MDPGQIKYILFQINILSLYYIRIDLIYLVCTYLIFVNVIRLIIHSRAYVMTIVGYNISTQTMLVVK